MRDNHVNRRPKIPAAGQHVWEWFVYLDRKRFHNGYSYMPIGHLEIDAWARLSGETLTPWELRALSAMDMEKMILLNSGDDESKDVVSARPMSVELFDALF
ncbi:MAG: phage tail assembly chaperone [Pyrinomonadaceae bacterium]